MRCGSSTCSCSNTSSKSWKVSGSFHLNHMNRQQVLHLAHLARLRLDDDEVERLEAQLETIIRYMDLLTRVPPGPETNLGDASSKWLRNDAPEPGVSRSVALSESAQTCSQGFVVPSPKGPRR